MEQENDETLGQANSYLGLSECLWWMGGTRSFFLQDSAFFCSSATQDEEEEEEILQCWSMIFMGQTVIHNYQLTNCVNKTMKTCLTVQRTRYLPAHFMFEDDPMQQLTKYLFSFFHFGWPVLHWPKNLFLMSDDQ